jgi:NADH-quinone oxidoreductase subunit J
MIIYIGAIAVLFLFVVMMLNVKSSSTPYIFYLFLIFLCSVLSDFLYGYLASDSFFIDLEFSFENTFLVDVLSNIEVFGQVLFGYYTICFLLAGILLLVAMIGAIVLTLNFNATQKSGFGFKQFSRSNSIVFFK